MQNKSLISFTVSFPFSISISVLPHILPAHKLSEQSIFSLHAVAGYPAV
jgi:hypothetical protein